METSGQKGRIYGFVPVRAAVSIYFNKNIKIRYKTLENQEGMTMTANENNFKETVNSLFKGMDSLFFCENSGRRGNPCRRYDHSSSDGCIFRCRCRCFFREKKDNGGGGMAGKMTPVQCL